MSEHENSSTLAAAAATVASRTQSFFRRRMWVWPLIAAAVLAFVGLWVRAKMEGAIQAEIAGNLKTIRDANAEALRGWAAAMRAQAELLAGDEQVRAHVEGLVNRAAQDGSSPPALTAFPEFAALREHLKPAEEGRGFAGYSVINTNLVVIAAAREQFVGLKAPPAYAEQLATCFEGNAQVTPPFATLSMLPDEKEGERRSTLAIMFVAAPVFSTNGQVVAVLALRILPERDFTRILATARSGASGETYAFSRNGLLLSESRFDDELKRVGLIPDSAAAHSLLTLDLRDPLVDLSRGHRHARRRAELPYVKAVSEAVAGRDGLDVHGYRDYRGVPVVGAWTWLPDFDMGLVTQLDVTEALAPVRVVRAGFWFLFGLLALGSVVVFILMRVARQAALRARQLGQYTLDEEIGSGAFGTVFRGHHALMRRPVAVKVLTPAADEPCIARFEREVQMTCQLNHPNTIALYDYGRTDAGLFYYAMEYLEGLSLSELIKRHGPQPEGRVIHILRQVCASLAEAHARGLVHRDIKPQNIFLTCRGGILDFVKVLDFGLVKARDVPGQMELTAVNATLGTPLYMSPEAVKGSEQVGERSDLYSLASVGYELLTGETVFCGASLAEVLLHQVRTQPEKPSVRLKRAVSPDLEDLLMQCLAKNPAARPASAAALDAALARCVSNGTWSHPQAEEWWSQKLADPKKVKTPMKQSQIHIWPSWAVCLLLGLVGCSTMPEVHTERDATIDLAGYRTFAVLPLAVASPATDPGAALRLARPAEQAARQTFAAKGLTETTREQADCAVLVRGESIPKLEVTNLGYTHAYFGRGRIYYPGGVTAADVQTTNQRRLIVEIYDNSSRRLAWVGWMQCSGTGKIKPDQVQEGIRRILAGFPPAQRP